MVDTCIRGEIDNYKQDSCYHPLPLTSHQRLGYFGDVTESANDHPEKDDNQQPKNPSSLHAAPCDIANPFSL
jgi:hypothetical protein